MNGIFFLPRIVTNIFATKTQRREEIENN